MMKWRKLQDFLFFFLFVIVVSKFLSKDNFLKCFTNSHLVSMINASRDQNLPNFHALYNSTQFDNFLREPFSLSLFKYMWYNIEPLQVDKKYYKKDWCYDNTHRMLGPPHFRQFRVLPDYCQVPWIMANVSDVTDCAAPWWSTAADDTWLYKRYWLNPEELDNNTYWSLQFNHSDWSQGFTVNWSYSINWSYTGDTDFTYYGRSGNSYPQGGYNRSLWGEETVELSVLDEGWVGHHTRVVLAQVTLYNVNTRYLTQVTLVAEQTFAGEFLTKIVVQSVDVVFEFDIWTVLFLVFIIIHFTRICTILNNVGLVDYFKEGYRLFVLLLLLLLLSSIKNLMQHYFMPVFPNIKFYQYHIDVKEVNQLQFYEKSNHFLFARSMICVVFVLAVVHIYISHLWRLGHHFLIFFRTLVISFKAVIWLASLLILFLTIFCSLCYLISSFLTVVINLEFVWKFSFIKISERQQFFTLRILCFMICFGSLIVSALMLVIFIHEYKEAKKFIVANWSAVDLIIFLTQEIGYFCKLKNPDELKKSDEFSSDVPSRKTMTKEENLTQQMKENSNEENLLMSDDNKQEELQPEIEVPTEKKSKLYSLLQF